MNSSKEDYMRYEARVNDRVCICFEERVFRHGEESVLQDAVENIRKSGCNKI